MSSSQSSALVPAQFVFTNQAPSLQLGQAGKARIQLGTPNGLSMSASSCTFTTHSAPLASRKLSSRKVLAKSRAVAAPFASMSLAAITVSAAAPQTGAAAPKKKKSLGDIIQHAGKKALSGGIPGMIAMALQVVTLMWMRTTINYQYRYGTSTMEALKTLYAQGGIRRFYQGMVPALLQGPLSRFGDTAANTGMLALLEDAEIPVVAKTIAASLAAGAFRIFLMPVDAIKTILQVEGSTGLAALMTKVKIGGPGVLYHGALAASAATFVGHYPWFACYNTLNELLPKYDELPKRLLRSAFIGFCCSFVSDCCSNSIRVIKTAKQTATVPMTYGDVVKMIIEKDGVVGLFGRGLGTKLISNGVQGILFSVLWRLGQDHMAKQEAAKKAAEAAPAK